MMRNQNVILNTIGDNPLMELMELDEFYGWTRRIRVLKSIFKEKKISIVPYVMVAVIGMVALTFIGTGIYLYFFF